MKKTIKCIADILKMVFGYGIMITIFLGGLTFFVYLAALIVGGDTAVAMCTFIYKQITPIIIYASTILVLLGLVVMYLSGEVALAPNKKR